MPTYTYQCQDCGHQYDAFQSMKAEPDTVCPECGGKVQRLIGAGAGIVFKGSGFYVTDYKKSGSGGSGGENASSGGAPSGGKSEKSSSSGSSGSSSNASTAKSGDSKGAGKSGDS